jgi:hypothetical protein
MYVCPTDYFYEGDSTSGYHDYQTQSLSWMMTTDIYFPPNSFPNRMFGLHQGALHQLPNLGLQNHTEFRWHRAAHLLCDPILYRRVFEFGRDHLINNWAPAASIYKNTEVP